jgi:hypothetical protein
MRLHKVARLGTVALALSAMFLVACSGSDDSVMSPDGGANLAMNRPNARQTDWLENLGNGGAATYNVMWDGYCDGMHLVVGADKTVGGVQTGCVGEPVIGAVGKFKGMAPIPGGSTVSAIQANQWPYTWYVLGNGTWSVYIASGDATTYVNSGTYTFVRAPQGHDNSGLPRATEL